MRHFLIIMILFFIVYIPLYYLVTAQLRKYLGLDFVVSVILFTFVGVYAPGIEVYFGAILVVFFCTVRGRVEAACRYILLAAIIPQIIWRIGAAGHYLGVIDAAGALGVAAYIVARFDRGGTDGAKIRGFTIEDFLVFVTFLIMAIGTTGFDKLDDTLRSWIQQFLLIITPYILFRSTLKSTEDYRVFVACFGMASLFLTVFAIFEARMSADIFDIITKHLTGIYVREMDVRGSLMRATATMNSPLELACFMTIGIFALVCSRSFFRNAFGYYGCLGVSSLGMVATQSRGSLIALVLATVVLSLALRKWAVATITTILAIVAWPALLVLAGMYPGVASFIHGGAVIQPGQYFDYRNLLLERGLQVAAEHPLLGMRLTQVMDSLADIVQGEGIIDMVNVYLEILLISGIVGFLPFIVLTLISSGRGTVGFKRVTDPSLLHARAFTLAAFFVVLFQLSFVSFVDRLPMLFVLAVFGIRLSVQEREAHRRSARSLAPTQPAMPVPEALPLPGREAAWVRLPA